jgi:L-malate glycosyltransferase
VIVGTVAPLRAEKNIARLIACFASACSTSAARLLIVGDGPERRTLEEAALRFGIAAQVVFAGHVDAPETVLGLIDIFAISSDTEQMPNALIQAMAASRPVVGVDVGDVMEILAPENRPLVPERGNDAAFATGIGTLVANAELRRRLGQANRDHVVRTYDIGLMVTRYRDLLESVLRSRSVVALPSVAPPRTTDAAGSEAEPAA